MSRSLESGGGVNRPPSYQQDQSDVWREIRKLRQEVRSYNEGSPFEVIFSYPGLVENATVGSMSPRYYFSGSGGTMHEWSLALNVNGTSNTTVRLYKNGDLLDTLTLGASTNYVTKRKAEAFVPGSDFLQADFAALGTFAEDLTVICRFKRS